MGENPAANFQGATEGVICSAGVLKYQNTQNLGGAPKCYALDNLFSAYIKDVLTI